MGCVPKRGNGEVCACAGLCDLVRGSIQPDVNGHIFRFKVTQIQIEIFILLKLFRQGPIFVDLGVFLSLLLYFSQKQFCSEILKVVTLLDNDKVTHHQFIRIN